MSNQETTSISQLSISEPLSTKSIGTEISFQKGSSSLKSKNSIESTTNSTTHSNQSNSNHSSPSKKSNQIDQLTTIKQPQNAAIKNLDLTFSNCFPNSSTPDSSASVW